MCNFIILVPFLIQKVQDNRTGEVNKISNSTSEKENENICTIITKLKSIIPSPKYEQRISDIEHEIALLKTSIRKNINIKL